MQKVALVWVKKSSFQASLNMIPVTFTVTSNLDYTPLTLSE